MKFTTFAFLVLCFNTFGQSNKEIINNTFSFKNGIYSSFDELISNNPKYPNCLFDMVKPPVGYPKLSYYNEKFEMKRYDDYLFAVVNNGILFLWYNLSFFKQLYLGEISIFVRTSWHSYVQKLYSTDEDFPNILDLKTGKIKGLNYKSISRILKRDNDIYNEFISVENKKNRKTLFSYIYKYDINNPIYIQK